MKHDQADDVAFDLFYLPPAHRASADSERFAKRHHMAQLNCSHLAVRKSFAAYAQDLVNETGGDFVLLNQCRRQVCTALWGAENGDVSGIGVW